MKHLVLVAFLAFRAHSQTIEQFDMAARPCNSNPRRLCITSIPMAYDAEGNGTLDAVRPADLAKALAALPVSLTRAEIAVMIAEAIARIPVPTPIPVETCPGPLLTQIDPLTIAVGSHWTLGSPCVIRQKLDEPAWGAPALISADLRLIAETRFAFAADSNCTAWFYVFRNEVGVAGHCLNSAGQRLSVHNLPPIGSWILGHAQIYGGKVRELLQPSAPQIHPQTWDRVPVAR